MKAAQTALAVARPVIGEILPTAVVRWCETSGDEVLNLFPAEAAALRGAGRKRLTEFMTVRWCARQALAQLGRSAAPIVPGLLGMPLWPSGVVGSMTHCPGYRAAAVATAADLTSVGIDAEPDLPLPEGVLDVVALPSERRELPGRGDVAWDRLLFSAKESTYKAWFPVTHGSLGFHEVEIVLSPFGTFTAHLHTPSPSILRGTHLAGRWVAGGGVVLTAVAVLPSLAVDITHVS